MQIYKKIWYINNKNLYFIINYIIMEKKHISIVLDPEILKKLDEGKYNRSKLIDSLLTKFFVKQEKNKLNKK